MTLSEIYSALFCGDPITIECSKITYHTIRTGLIRKYRNSSDQLDAIGDTSMQDQYVACSYDSKTIQATFQIKATADKKRKPANYTLI